MANTLSREFQFYIDHQDEMVAQFNGKTIAIKDQQVLGAFDSTIEAVRETQKEHALGTFLVQRVSPGPEAYTHTFHSRDMSF